MAPTREAVFDPLFRSAHLQTLVAHFWPRRLDEGRFPVERRLVRTEPEVQVLVQVQRPAATPRGHVVLVHGLESSGETGYMRGMAQAALERGYAAHRFNLRTCGGTQNLCRTLYHSGLTVDLLAYVGELQKAEPRAIFLVGFSLGGNVVLKLAGELGEAGGKRLAGVCAVSTPIELGASCDRIAQRDNRIYERRFLRRMRRRLCATGRYRPEAFAGVRSIRDIDERITAPAFGFRGADHYYATQSSAGFLHAVRVPALLVQSRDDTFVPFASFGHRAIRENPCIELLATDCGGHLGFLRRARPHFWLDGVVLDWIGKTGNIRG